VDRGFDAVLIMFAGLGYQVEDDDVRATLQSVHRHLRPGGLFLSDLWYGPAVLAIRPSERVKAFEAPDGRLVRRATGTLDVSHHTVEIRFALTRWRAGNQVTETTEMHRCRFFFRPELAAFLDDAGLAMLGLTAFPELDKPADETTWNVALVAKAI
jgi:hypothetical protein